jgi:large subunit ribosomal protein L25
MHPAKGSLYHLSFFAVSAQESVDVGVPLHFVGDAIGVKQEGGLLDPVMTQLQMRCAPDNIPDAIEIDVSNLSIGDNLHVREIVLPQGVTAVDEPERIVVSVLSPEKTVEDTGTETAESES